MTEPTAVASEVEQVVPGVWRWTIHDERIDYESDAHALASDAGVVLIDPLPLADEVLAGLGPDAAICITAGCHQRSAWRLRERLEIPVWAPVDAYQPEERPDREYRDGDSLPGGLQAIQTPGPEEHHYALLREGKPAVLFVADLVVHVGGPLAFVPGEYMEDAPESRESMRRLLERQFDVLCLDHGSPIVGDPHEAIRNLLERVGAR